LDEQQVLDGVTPRELWFGVAAGPILWAVHLVLSYGLVSLACSRGFFNFTASGVAGIVVVLTALTLVFAAVVLYAGILARRNRREFDERGTLRGRVEERHHFLATSGMLLSALFFPAIVVSLIPAFVLGPCAVV